MTGQTASIGAPGTFLAGRYEVVRRIARGGMGQVLEAHDRQLDRRVAVKLLHDGAAQHEPRFGREIELLARLNHPGLVQVYDAGVHDGSPFVVLELVDGPPLRRILTDRARLPEGEVAALGAALADALAYVHDEGVVHRDVTPGNVLCGADGRPRLTDFGIARLADATSVTATGTTIGTAAYMAPEQVQGNDVTAAADVYALGLVLLEALTGRRAFDGTTAEVAIARLVRDPDTADAPERWRPLLVAMTARDPGARPTAAAVRERLAALAPDADAAIVAPVGGHDATRAMAGGTSVLPTALVAAAASGAATEERDPGAARPRHVLWGMAAGLLVAVALGLASRSGGIDVPPSTTVEPAVRADSTTTDPPTTTTTSAPAPPPEDDDEDDDEDEGRGEGNGGHDRKGEEEKKGHEKPDD